MNETQSKKFKLHLLNWINGELQKVEHEFETFELALSFSRMSRAQMVKIYNELGELLHSTGHDGDGNTYA